MSEAVFYKSAQTHLANHVVAKKKASNAFECSQHCMRFASCKSINYKISGIGKGLCELNDKTIQETIDADKEANPEFSHLSFIIETGKF